MSRFNRRRFLQLSALGLGSIIAPAVLSDGIRNWPRNFRKFQPGQFLHGVASGDPLGHAVILWTRVTPMDWRRNDWDDEDDYDDDREDDDYSDDRDDDDRPRRRNKKRKILVGWEVATDPHFDHLVRRGSAVVSRKTDYTLKVDVVGLNPGSTYYYRFRTINRRSPVGVTRTLPAAGVSQVKLAVMSCSNYPAGYFNAYQDASSIPDLDAVLHLGDYIYEYANGEYATEVADQIGRGFAPGNDTGLFSLKNYRERYAQYRTDRGLQNLHAAAPFICVWDDHEVANDAWKEGAENHNEGEGSFSRRKRRALRAYYEWLPIRPVVEDNREIIYRSFQFGDLVNLMMLDTRIVGRDLQLDYANYIDPASGALNAPQFIAEVSDPNRTLLGFEQRAWLQGQLAGSNATWDVLGQQVLIGRMNLPAELLLNLADPAGALVAFQGLATIKGRILAEQAGFPVDPPVTAAERTRVETAIPYNLDAWDGYAFEREVVFGTASKLNKNLVVLSGDTHNAWANNLRDPDGNPIGVEFAASSVSSPGLEDFLGLVPEQYPTVEGGFELLIDDLQYLNVGDRGYLVVTFTPDQAIADWQFVDNILSEDFSMQEDRARTLKVNTGANEIDLSSKA